MIHNVSVRLVNRVHRCEPTVTEVHGGDTVHWASRNIDLFFPDSPFVEGQGPFNAEKDSTVKKGLKKGARFKPEVRPGGQPEPVEGEVIVVDPG